MSTPYEQLSSSVIDSEQIEWSDWGLRSARSRRFPSKGGDPSRGDWYFFGEGIAVSGRLGRGHLDGIVLVGDMPAFVIASTDTLLPICIVMKATGAICRMMG